MLKATLTEIERIPYRNISMFVLLIIIDQIHLIILADIQLAFIGSQWQATNHLEELAYCFVDLDFNMSALKHKSEKSSGFIGSFRKQN